MQSLKKNNGQQVLVLFIICKLLSEMRFSQDSWDVQCYNEKINEKHMYKPIK